MLLGLFFVSTGASLDLQLLVHEFPIIIALLIGLLAVKVGIIGTSAQFFGLNKCASACHNDASSAAFTALQCSSPEGSMQPLKARWRSIWCS